MANPIVRDFNSRSRAGTQTAPSTRHLSFDVEANRRPNSVHSVLPRHGSGEALTRSNTIRNYHAETPSMLHWEEPGAEPGIDPTQDVLSQFSFLQQPCQVTIVDVSEERIQRHRFDNEELISFLQQPRENWVDCRWINVNGLSFDVIRALGREHKLHRLAIEDLLSAGGRTKADFYKDHTFILLTLQKLVQKHDSDSGSEEDVQSIKGIKKWKCWGKRRSKKSHSSRDSVVSSTSGTNNGEKSPPTFDSIPLLADSSFRTLQRFRVNANPERALFMERNSSLTRKGLAVNIEQVSIFLTRNNTVISLFQHSADDVEEPILKRLEAPDTILRRTADASMILQAVIDAIIDLAIPVTAAYEDIMGELELDVLTDPSVERSRSLYILSSELYLLRSYMQPIANVISALRDHSRDTIHTGSTAPAANSTADDTATPTPCKKSAIPTVAISSIARTYFGDIEDTCVMITSNLDIMRRTTSDLIDLTYNQVGSFQNESMKQLTAVTICFLPLTFLTGYFGQNFHTFTALDNSDVYFWKIAVPLIVATILVLTRPMLWRLMRKTWQRQWISRTRKARKGKKRFS